MNCQELRDACKWHKEHKSLEGHQVDELRKLREKSLDKLGEMEREKCTEMLQRNNIQMEIWEEKEERDREIKEKEKREAKEKCRTLLKKENVQRERREEKQEKERVRQEKEKIDAKIICRELLKKENNLMERREQEKKEKNERDAWPNQGYLGQSGCNRVQRRNRGKGKGVQAVSQTKTEWQKLEEHFAKRPKGDDPQTFNLDFIKSLTGGHYN